MIAFSAVVQDLLRQPVVESFYAIKIGETYRKTSLFSNITLGGLEYVADGAILSVEPPKMVSVVDKQQFKISIIDNHMELGAAAEGALLGMPVEVRAVFLNAQGVPHTDLQDTLLIYKGVVDSAAYAISTSRLGSVIFNITCSSPMSDLDLTKTYYTSQEYLDKNHPGDTSYTQVHEGAGAINLKWGKK